jgi:hypothetical protein
MISETRKQQLRDLASQVGQEIKRDREPLRLLTAERQIADRIERLSLNDEETDFLIDEIRYGIDPSSRLGPDGRRIILDHDVSAFLKVVAELRTRLAPKNKK